MLSVVAIVKRNWVQDPECLAWEAFHTLDSVPTFNVGRAPRR